MLVRVTETPPFTPRHLAKGANIALRDLDATVGGVTVVLDTQATGGRVVDGDVSVLLLGPDRSVRSSDDFIFYNQPIGLGGSISLGAKIRAEADGEDGAGDVTVSDTITVELDAVPDGVECIVVAASLDPSAGTTFGDAARIAMRVQRTSDAEDLVLLEINDVTTETALLFGEFYRRNDEWKLRAIGQGYDGGLASLVTEHGVDIADGPPATSLDADLSEGHADPSPGGSPMSAATKNAPPASDRRGLVDTRPLVVPSRGKAVSVRRAPGTRQIHAHVVDGTRLKVEVESDQGATLVLVGGITDLEPTVESSGVLGSNPALVSNLWAFAKTWYEGNIASLDDALGLVDPEEQRAALKVAAERKKAATKRAETFAKVAQWIADVADDVSPHEPEFGWCSSCYFKTEHRKSNRPAGQLPVYVCQGCGSPTLPCVAPRCDNMAVRERGALRVPQYCAEHRHDITGFEKAHHRIGELHDYEAFLKYEKPDLSKATKLAGVGIVGLTAAAPLALLAAPAIGGAIGSMGIFGGLSGAAATSHGLVLLGGGTTVAAGGLGMAGGTTVVTAVGAAVGGTLGASISNAYLREDKSFRIELLRPGKGGVPVIVANGFHTEGDNERWGGWRAIVDTKYPNSPVYRVRWGSKELKDWGSMVRTAAGVGAIRVAAATATKAGAKFFGRAVATPMMAGDLAKNPWHVARNRADKTGVILGDLIARTDTESYALVGHSLGARVMVVAAEALGTKPGGPRIQSAHLLGAAIRAQSRQSNWDALTAAVDEAVYCYYSANDGVLKFVYQSIQGGQSAAGRVGFKPAAKKLVNVDVSESVKSHFDYQDDVRLL